MRDRRTKGLMTGTSIQRDGFLVLGMHRSGTSALTGTLMRLGAAGPRTPMVGRPDNLKGHWESIPLIAFHDELLASAGSVWHDWRPFNADWYGTPVASQFKARAKELLASEFGNSPVFVLKDPRICRFIRFWLEIFAEEGITPRLLMPVRNPLEVAHSLKTRDGMSLNLGLLLWLRHTLDAEGASRQSVRSLLMWDRFLADWRPETARMAAELGVRWPRLSDRTAMEVDGFLAPELRHERQTSSALETHPDVHDWVRAAFDAMSELSHNPGSNSARAVLDDVRARFETAAQLFGRALATIEADASAHRGALDLERAAHAATLAALDAARLQFLTELEAERARCAALQAEAAQAGAEAETRAAAHAALQAAHEALTAELARQKESREADLARLTQELAAVQQGRQELEGQFDALSAELAERRAEQERLLAATQAEAAQARAEAQAALDRAEQLYEQTLADMVRALQDAELAQADQSASHASIVAQLHAQAGTLSARLTDVEMDSARKASELLRNQQEITQLRQHHLDLEQTLHVMQNARSWRWTKPLRHLLEYVRR
jgi:hypothetical protein